MNTTQMATIILRYSAEDSNSNFNAKKTDDHYIIVDTKKSRPITFSKVLAQIWLFINRKKNSYDHF
jgi:hypothetical protein